VFLLSNAPAARLAMLWAAVLWAGDDAVLGFRSAAEVLGLAPLGNPGDLVVVVIPWERQSVSRRGIKVRRRRHLHRQISVGWPPTTSVEITTLDLASEAQTVRDAVGWVTRAYQRRLTSPARLALALHGRVRIRRRQLLKALVTTIDATTESPLEHEYVVAVESAHGLPRARRQVKDRVGTRDIRRDFDYEDYDTVVELDGRLGHEDAWDQFRDLDRDNATTVDGSAHLRFGFADVFGRPCAVSAQVGQVLQRNGWTGDVRRCGPNCTALG